MAQFSTVDGITTMNASIAQLSESFNANQALQAATMVGREVLTEDDSALLTGGAPLSGAVDMPYASPGAIVRIYSEAGELVGRVALGPRNAGLANFSWNGTRTDGSAAPPGRYLISGAIESSAGDVPLATYAASRVQSVTLGGATGTQLSTDSGLQVRLSQVKAIR
jgi:flagellar basal-body rod modification protein FlgD